MSKWINSDFKKDWKNASSEDRYRVGRLIAILAGLTLIPVLGIILCIATGTIDMNGDGYTMPGQGPAHSFTTSEMEKPAIKNGKSIIIQDVSALVEEDTELGAYETQMLLSVKNESNKNVGSFDVIAKVTDADGKLVEEKKQNVGLLRSGEERKVLIGSIGDVTSDEVLKPADVKLSIANEKKAEKGQIKTEDLEVSKFEEVENGEGSILLRGDVTNNSKKDADNVHVGAVFYNKDKIAGVFMADEEYDDEGIYIGKGNKERVELSCSDTAHDKVKVYAYPSGR